MKNGKIILGAAAAVVTVASSLAFNAAHKFKSIKAYGLTANGGCKQCASLWTNHALGQVTVKICHAGAHGSGATLRASKTTINNVRTAAWHTALTSGGVNCTAIHQTTKVTVAQ